MATNSKPINLIFCAQGSALTIFDRLLPPLRSRLPLHTVGIYVADQLFHDRYLSRPNNFTGVHVQWLKEWEINQQASRTAVDLGKISAWEKQYGHPNFWPALIADRRIFLGPLTKYKQDYAPRLSYNQMLRRLQASIDRIEQFIDRLQPATILGFNMVTLDEFIFYLIARRRGIPYWQMKNAKINNLITLFPDPLNLAGYLSSPEHPAPDASAIKSANQYLHQIQARNAAYEGHIVLKSPTLKSLFDLALLRRLVSAAAFSALKPYRYLADTQSAGLAAVWQFSVVKPINAIRHHRLLSRHYLPADRFPHTPYVFFPLHTEPEIALSIYGRYFQNQIEVIRNIAQSLPVTWSVVVKDHPRSLGFRKIHYYQKLLQIPNVKLVDPFLPSWDIIDHAKAVVTISSWVGFEAVIAKKPVITFGECIYNNLPDSMVVKNASYTQLPADIQRAIRDYRYDEAALLHHLARIISLSFPINMYSDVLAKPNRHSGPSAPSSPDRLWSDFASYICSAAHLGQ